MKIKMNLDKAITWRGGSDPLVADSITTQASDPAEWHKLMTVVGNALHAMEYGNIEKIVIEKLD
tara:strand:+ start:508 stop:699 length:192 start_codon:yes stop_codon:yes gene_type:complete